MPSYSSPKGMPDLLPAEMPKWHVAEARLRGIFSSFGYEEIRTPFLEESELFARSIGTATDIVEKEMFTFADSGGKNMSLRPEGTASVLRAYLEHHLGHGNEIVKVYYLGPMFRHERPQKGRQRQFYQVGAEILGTAKPLADVDLMVLLMKTLQAFDVPDVNLEINSVGDAECRPAYRATLQAYLKSHAAHLCENCLRRTEINPLRVLDCKNEHCRETLKDAPLITDQLCDGCREHFDRVKEGLSETGMPFTVNPRIIRGLDYYERTAFEATAGGLGSQNAVAGGGRYDGLAEVLGGPHTPAIGFAMGIERLLMSARTDLGGIKKPRIEFLPLDGPAEVVAMKLACELRDAAGRAKNDAIVECSPASGSLKAALRRANKNEAKLAVLIGENELKNGTAAVKDLAAHAQEDIAFTSLTEKLLEKLR